MHARMIEKKFFHNIIHYCIGKVTKKHQLDTSKIEKVILNIVSLLFKKMALSMRNYPQIA